MNSSYTPYESLKKWRDNLVATHQFKADELHHFHELVLKKVYAITLEIMISENGLPPCEFTWFMMGSAGRCEQAVISDQDHGIIYEKTSEQASIYFLDFGKRLCLGLHYLGYPYCDGNVMSSNSLWCQSIIGWEEQINNWLDEASWESVRCLIIFFDGRAIAGEAEPVLKLKRLIHQAVEKHPLLLGRFLENTMYIEKSVGLFNHFLTVGHGPYTDCIDLKKTAFFPYVNAIRILAIKENISETSTILRLESLLQIAPYCQNLEIYYANFVHLLGIRLHHASKMKYEEIHYLQVKRLSKGERHALKQILKDGRKLYHYVGSIVNRVIKNEI